MSNSKNKTPARSDHTNSESKGKRINARSMADELADLNWVYTGADACGPFLSHNDGSMTVLGRRERPHLLLDSRKRPVMLTNGVSVCPVSGDQSGYCPGPRNDDRSWTLAQPIRVS